MSSRLPGVTGTLFPIHYLEEQLDLDAAPLVSRTRRTCSPRKFETWWHMVEQTCGPASGLRALFDIVAMPLAAMLGFQASQASFARDRCTAVLRSPAGTPVALLVLPWATRPAGQWRDVTAAARDIGASWCLVLAPPFLSLVDARGFATRRSLDLSLPDLVTDPPFAVLMTLVHADGFDRQTRGAGPRLDALIYAGTRYQARVRDDLQHGVTDALAVLSNAVGQSSADARAEALTLIYRILFLLFAESRHLVPGEDPTYRSAYAMGTLCREALRSEPRFALWDALAATSRLSRVGCRTPELTVHPFNGRLFAKRSAPALEERSTRRRTIRSRTQESAMRRALVALGSRPGRAGREPISYRDLGVEQLGAVYEHLLDDPSPAALTPRRRGRPSRHSASRKATGTFYTPRSLAEFVVRRTLAPLVAGVPADGILALRVVDPAMGSGAFLVAACRYLAAAYGQALVEEGRASPEDLDEREQAGIRRRIAERCLVGVDKNPVAVQLARLSLWLTTLAGGKPLSFLDHRLRTGDSLLGASPDDLSRVLPQGRRPGTVARPEQLPLFEARTLEQSVRRFIRPFGELLDRHDDTLKDVKRKEALWHELAAEGSAIHPWRLASSLWCAQFFWPAESGSAPSASEFRALVDVLVRGDRTLRSAHVVERVHAATAVAETRRFFHWPLEFPDVFFEDDGSPRATSGFDAVIGNPPWEMWRRDDAKESPASGANEHRSFMRFIRDSGLYPSCDRGHLNLYQPFLERSLFLARKGGRIGLILPWGLATDDGAAKLRSRLIEDTSLETIVGLDNAGGLFPIHRGTRFLVLVASPGGRTRETRARFGVTTTAELDDLPSHNETNGCEAYPVRLTPGRLARISGATRRIPDVRRPSSLELAERLCSEFPAVGSDAAFGCRFGRELNATEARRHFGDKGLPVIEGKHLSPFRTSMSATAFVERSTALALLPDGRYERARLAYRDVSGVGNKLSLIAAVVPADVVTTHTVFCLRSPVAMMQQHFICGLFNSYVLNGVVRLLMGGHLTTGLVEGLPVPAWRGDDEDLLMAALARELGGPRARATTHAELQARVARRYGLSEAELHGVLTGFPLVPAAERRQVLAALTQLRQ